MCGRSQRGSGVAFNHREYPPRRSAAVISAVFLSRQYLEHSGTTNYSLIGLVVLGLVLIHPFQRRPTVRRLLFRQVRIHHASEHRSAQAISDVILWPLIVNAMVSGIADFLNGHTNFLPITGSILFQKWHAMGAIVPVVEVIVHAVRRRRRLLTSLIK